MTSNRRCDFSLLTSWCPTRIHFRSTGLLKLLFQHSSINLCRTRLPRSLVRLMQMSPDCSPLANARVITGPRDVLKGSLAFVRFGVVIFSPHASRSQTWRVLVPVFNTFHIPRDSTRTVIVGLPAQFSARIRRCALSAPNWSSRKPPFCVQTTCRSSSRTR